MNIFCSFLFHFLSFSLSFTVSLSFPLSPSPCLSSSICLYCQCSGTMRQCMPCRPAALVFSIHLWLSISLFCAKRVWSPRQSQMLTQVTSYVIKRTAQDKTLGSVGNKITTYCILGLFHFSFGWTTTAGPALLTNVCP